MKAYRVSWVKKCVYAGQVFAKSAEEAKQLLEEFGVGIAEFPWSDPFDDEIVDDSWVLDTEELGNDHGR